MTRIDPPCLTLPEPAFLHREPQLAILAALDSSLAAVAAALDARHGRPTVACWAPGAQDDVRLAAALIVSVRALRELIADYGTATERRVLDELPF